MQGEPEVVVLRIGHRPGRDDRMTTHVGLTARALGADRLILPDNATDAFETAEEVTAEFGGPFTVESTDAPLHAIREWDGLMAHLTMYGLPIQELDEELRAAHGERPLLVVVGAEKVPFEVYEHADWNVAITNQPHSEVAGLAVFLDRLFDGRELHQDWSGASKRVEPMATGKSVEEIRD
jgi:tRNA (cytidine56-2'-O)-methyltransferase